MKAESLIFDIDGTLWDSRSLVAAGYNRQLIAEGREDLLVTAEALKPLFGKTLPQIADVIFATVPAPERYDLMDRCTRSEDAYLREDPCRIGYPGVKETLEALKEKYRLFIVSNSQAGYPQLCMEKMGLTEVFAGTLCHGDTGLSKGKTIRALMERYHIRDCYYIGDTQGDYEATVEAGVPFLWAAYGFGTPEHFDARVDSFRQLTELL